MLSRQIDAFMGCDRPFDEADIVMFGAPFDGTTSFRPGTRSGPRAIRVDSIGLEEYSPYLDAELSEVAVCDAGDLELAIGDSQLVLAAIEEAAADIFAAGKVPFMLGGEHLVTLGAVRAAVRKYPDLHIVHFDAHADLRDDYLGVKFSHACVLRRCWELVGKGRIHQFGIRSGDRSEFEFAASETDMHKFDFDGLEGVVQDLAGKPVYFTLDLDVLDPSVFPGTGTPEPGGVSFDKLRRAATFVARRCNVIGLDVNELSPHYDASGASTAAACKIVRELLIALGIKEK